MLARLQQDAKLYAELENTGTVYKMKKFLKADFTQYLQNPNTLKQAIETVEKLLTILTQFMQKEVQYYNCALALVIRAANFISFHVYSLYVAKFHRVDFEGLQLPVFCL